MTETNSEDVIDSQMQTSPPAVVDNSHCSSQTAPEPLAVYEEVKEAEEEVMELQTADEDTISSHIAVTDPVKIALFQLGPVMKNIEKAHPNFTVQIKDDGVHIEGTDRQKLEHIKHTISDFLGNLAETHFTLEPVKAEFFARKDVKERLLQTINQAGSPTMYSVSDSKVVVTSLSQNSANQACNLLKSHMCNISIPVDVEYEGILYCREWSEFVQGLGFASVKVSERGGNIDVVTLKGMENEKQTAILQFLSTPIDRETVISMEPGMLKYIQTHCHQLLADMDQVTIFPLEAEDVCGLKVCYYHILLLCDAFVNVSETSLIRFSHICKCTWQIHGYAVACQMAEEVLQGVVNSICTRTITVNAPGVARFLEETECKSILNEMESKFQVYITTKHMPWKPLPHQVAQCSNKADMLLLVFSCVFEALICS